MNNIIEIRDKKTEKINYKIGKDKYALIGGLIGKCKVYKKSIQTN